MSRHLMDDEQADRVGAALGRPQRTPAGKAASAAALAARLEKLRDEMRQRHLESAAVFERVHPDHRRSAQNLVDYLTLRSHDIRTIQTSLAELGVSSLGRAEEHVITSLERVLDMLHFLSGDEEGRRTESAVGFGEGRRMLELNAANLLGPAPAGRATRILVTMPSEAAEDPHLVRELLAQGMDCARINCAHDGPEQWAEMIRSLREEAASAGRLCPILMDLPGPKLRTGPVEDGPRVVCLRPKRDPRGCPTAPARALLVAVGARPGADSSGEIAIPVPERFLEALEQGDRITLRDTRGDRRHLDVVEAGGGLATVEAWDTTYVETGTVLVAPTRTAAVGVLAPVEQGLRLRPGDVLTLTADCSPVSPIGARLADGRVSQRIGCTIPAALRAMRPGHRIWFDDGKIGGSVIDVRAGEVDVVITVATPGGSSLKAEKGINIPDSPLHLPALGPEDAATLEFIASNADLVGLSFAQRESDVSALQRQLAELGGSNLGIVLKIETALGFNHLPELILTAMASERVGVMIARGDLAVECGYERLAEVQEEILWLCDAAHVPVIWATQVLDQMARTGRPSRAEVSDAAMSGQAECVMLNKGPHIGEAVAALDDILRRMSEHQDKKVALLRRLRSWAPAR